tara:strand:+ start:105 stop:530 length:426 start_codon:yes stop_codon:yes gene_type:complete
MGIFGSVFSNSQQNSKFKIIKYFAKERMEKMGINGSQIDSMDESILEGLPESTIFTIVETYIDMKNKGLDDHTIFNNIENHRSSFDPFPNPTPLPANLNIKNYIYYRMEFELPTDSGFNIGENGVTRDFIDRVIEKSISAF